MTTRLTGRAAAPGAALAPAFPVSPALSATAAVPEERQGTAEEEQARLADALERAERELNLLAERVAKLAGEAEGEIFEAHAAFAADPELKSTADDAIENGTSAERATITAFGTFRELLAGSASEYLAARAEDLDDVRDRVVAILMGFDTFVPIPDEPSIIVAHELSPSQTASIPREVISGIAVETGSPTSHAAILARSLGIPAVVACEGLLDTLEEGTIVAIDGRDGIVLIDPSDDERQLVEERIRLEDKHRTELTALRDEPGRTADGRRVELAANIGTPEDLDVAVEAGAEGSGLVRTEFLFLNRKTPPSVEDQIGFYTEVLRAFPGHRVVFRTMDIGADKPLAFVDRDPEDNPALGLRGIRLSLQRPELLRDQLVALLRAREAVTDQDAGRLAIMFPLVSKASELAAARQLVEDVAEHEGIDLDDVEIGVMIEVPSAALAADRLAAHADFFSIGTNDLLQYLFAADRMNAAVGDLADVCEPDVLALIGDVIATGHEHDAWVGVCGEAASDPTVAAALVGLGVDELSMTRVAIPEVKDTLRELTSHDCRVAVEAAIAEAGDGTQARDLLETQLGIEPPPWAGRHL
jgi:phosphoenolpyruvate-protein phosphotransferase (PTS system enzyme I)